MRPLTHKAVAVPCSLLMLLAASMSARAAETAPMAAAARVSRAGIDLSQPQGADLLYARIRAAARVVCEPVAANEPYRFAQLAERSCENKAIEGAVAKVHAPLLSAVHRGQAAPTLLIAQK